MTLNSSSYIQSENILTSQLWKIVNHKTNAICSAIVSHFGVSKCRVLDHLELFHYSDFIMSTMASQITSFTIVHSTVYSGEDQRKHQSSASLAFVRGIHRWPVNSPHKGPVTRKMFSFDDVIMIGLTFGDPFPVLHMFISEAALPKIYIWYLLSFLYKCMHRILISSIR